MFEVGKKVICIKSHSRCDVNGVRKGKVFEVIQVRKSVCLCPDPEIDINIKAPAGWINDTYCSRCMTCHPSPDCVWWFGARIFAPLTDETIGDKTIEELMGDTVTVYNERYFQLEQQNINHSAH